MKRFVQCSTTGVLGHVEHPPADESAPYNVEDIYQVTKAEGEKLAMEFAAATGLSVVAARPAAVYGPGDRRLFKLFKLVSTGRFRMVGDGETLIHPVYVDDLIDGLLRCYEREVAIGQIFNLGGDEYLSLNRWVSIIAKEAGVHAPVVKIPYLPVRIAQGFARIS